MNINRAIYVHLWMQLTWRCTTTSARSADLPRCKTITNSRASTPRVTRPGPPTSAGHVLQHATVWKGCKWLSFYGVEGELWYTFVNLFSFQWYLHCSGNRIVSGLTGVFPRHTDGRGRSWDKRQNLLHISSLRPLLFSARFKITSFQEQVVSVLTCDGEQLQSDLLYLNQSCDWPN